VGQREAVKHLEPTMTQASAGEPGAAALALPGNERSPGRARRIVRAALLDAGRTEKIDEALLLVTEIATNAVIHAGTPIELAVDIGVDEVTIRITDFTPGLIGAVPAGVPSGPGESGRGLWLVDRLASCWGTRHEPGRKTVWFTLAGGPGTVPVDGQAARAGASEPAGSAAEVALVGSASPTGPAQSRYDLAWLTEIGDRLLGVLDVAEVLRELLYRLAETLGTPAALVRLVGDDNGPTVAAAYGLPPDVAPGLAGAVVVPLRLDGPAVGALELLPAEGRPLDPDGRALAQLTADRMALAVRTAQLGEAESRRRGALAFIAEASELLAGSLDVELTLALVSQLVVPRLARWCAVHILDERGSLGLAAVGHADEDQLPGLRQELAGPAAVAEVQGALLADHPVLPAGSALAGLAGGLGDGTGSSCLLVPLRARRRTLGVMTLARASTRYAPDESAMVEDLGRRAALAVANARLYGEQVAVAQALQRSLLPPDLPDAPGFEFGACYVAAGEGNGVGGDFYDVVPRTDGSWVLAVGDVCGKGAEAAAVTGLARNVVRLLSRDGRPLPEILSRLNDAILDQGERRRFCTVAAAHLVPDGTGVLVGLCNAGHPLPMFVGAGGDVRPVGETGTLLGVLEDIGLSEVQVRLGAGDALVFYTDGVTERRDGGRMFGDHLRRVLRESAGLSATAIAGRVQAAARDFAADAPRDDLAILVVRRVS